MNFQNINPLQPGGAFLYTLKKGIEKQYRIVLG